MAKKKEYSYFKGFVKLSDYSLKCGKMLKDVLDNYKDVNITKKITEIHAIEHEADLAKHDMMNHLMKEFLPPIEREDIISLANKIDDITDSIEDIVIRFDMYNVNKINPEIQKFSRLIVDCCKNVKEALKEFNNFKKSKDLQKKIIEINQLEEEGDALYISVVRKLYKTSKDPVELLIWTDLFACFEKCFDACEDVADDIATIVMKNS